MNSLVIPVYRNVESIPSLLQALTELAAGMVEPLQVVFVVDGSPDRSHALLAEQLPSLPFATQLLLLSRNFGSFAAIRCGLEAARGERFAVMAAATFVCSRWLLHRKPAASIDAASEKGGGRVGCSTGALGT